MLSIFPIIIIIAVIIGRKRVFQNCTEHIASSNTIVEETLQGIMNVKAFANELFEAITTRENREVVTYAIKGGNLGLHLHRLLS